MDRSQLEARVRALRQLSASRQSPWSLRPGTAEAEVSPPSRDCEGNLGERYHAPGHGSTSKFTIVLGYMPRSASLMSLASCSALGRLAWSLGGEGADGAGVAHLLSHVALSRVQGQQDGTAHLGHSYASESQCLTRTTFHVSHVENNGVGRRIATGNEFAGMAVGSVVG